jgi:OHCU decarboxylase
MQEDVEIIGDPERAAFIARYGGIYEHSPWVPAEVFDAGLPEKDPAPSSLAPRFAAIVAAAGRARQIALIRAHPDLAGRLAVVGALTDSSRSEQAGAGLDRCMPEEFSRFQALNDAYKAKFGFPFILAVAGRSRAEILDAFEARMENDPETEFSTALREIDKIARLRLQAMEGL